MTDQDVRHEHPTTGRSHDHEIRIDAAPERVWSAITDPEELTRWFPLEAECEPGEGGSITYRWGSFEGRNVIRVWRPNEHLSTSWSMGDDDGDAAAGTALVVDWFLEPSGSGTVLRVVHSGFGDDASFDEEYDGTRRGWQHELGSLKRYLELHDGRTRRAIWITKATDLSPQAVLARLAADDGPLNAPGIDAAREGDAYELELAGVVLRGTVRKNGLPQEFIGTVDNLRDGLLRFGHETCGGAAMAHVWLSTWGVDADEVASVEARWRAAFERALS